MGGVFCEDVLCLCGILHTHKIQFGEDRTAGRPMKLVPGVAVRTTLLLLKERLDFGPSDTLCWWKDGFRRRRWWWVTRDTHLVSAWIVIVWGSLGSTIHGWNGDRSDAHCLLPAILDQHEKLEGGEVRSNDGCVTRGESGEQPVVLGMIHAQDGEEGHDRVHRHTSQPIGKTTDAGEVGR